jgi:hypothetical protein
MRFRAVGVLTNGSLRRVKLSFFAGTGAGGSHLQNTRAHFLGSHDVPVLLFLAESQPIIDRDGRERISLDESDGSEE